MNIEAFTKLMRLLDLKQGDPIEIVYRGNGEQTATGAYIGIDHVSFPIRIEWFERDVGIRDLCYRNIITINGMRC